jgi:hypothetical protein
MSHLYTRFYYKHVFIFHLFRNLFFFLPVLTALAILFVVGELRCFCSRPMDSFKDRAIAVVYTIAAHAFFMIFFSKFTECAADILCHRCIECGVVLIPILDQALY